MATVYLAHDRKHDRQVAIKVLPPELALAVRTQRFLREIRIAAKLNHPHILPLLDSGEAAGRLYYVMPYVDGESLRDRLEREHRLPVADALQLAREVADALSYAHNHGVVHRDIKPGNILLSGGHAVVADFGIARAFAAAEQRDVTETGVSLGTPAYMSPEQASGGQVDGRSDLYSLGCVLYEMLAGESPFPGPSSQTILARHLVDPMPSVRAANPAVSEVVDAAVTRALAKRPAERFGTAAEFAGALVGDAVSRPAPRRAGVPSWPWYKGTVAVLAVAGLAFLGAGVWRWRATAAARAEVASRSVAVLPFVNLSGNPENEYLSDGVSEELIDALVQLPDLRVPARSSSFFFKGKNLSLRQIGESLQVAAVVQGSLRTAGSRLRITAQLIKVSDGSHLWSETYDRELADVRDVITVEEEIARAIVGTLKLKLGGDTAAVLVRRYTSDPDAYELYLRGRYFWNRRTAQDLNQAVDYFSRAIAEDSTYALAYSGVADTYVLMGQFGYLPEDEAYPKARAAATRALALDETLAEAHTSLARVLRNDGDLAGAEREFRRAIELNPNYALAHSWYAITVLLESGRVEAALREARLGVELEPHSAMRHSNLAGVFLNARRYDQAIAEYEKAVEMQDWEGWHRFIGSAYLGAGRFDEAIRHLTRAIEGEPNARTPGDLGALGHVYARQGNRSEALRIRDRLLRMPRTANVWEGLAIVYAGLGDKDRAFDALERARAAGLPLFRYAPDKNDPLFDPLRSDPRFAELLKRLGRES
jgi:serine/threonine-protein kinase